MNDCLFIYNESSTTGLIFTLNVRSPRLMNLKRLFKEAVARRGSFLGQILAEARTTNKRKESQFEKRKIFSATCLESPVCARKPSTPKHKDSKQASPETCEPSFLETNYAAVSQVETRATSPAHETFSIPVASVQNTDCMVGLMVVPAQAYGDDNSSFIDSYCLLNSGSEISPCVKSLLIKLQIPGQPVV